MIAIKTENNNFRLVRGDTLTIELELVNENNEVVDLTSCSGTFTIKDNLGDLDTLAKVRKNFYNHPLTSLSGGICHFKIDTTDTNNLESKKYFYDIEIKKPVYPSGLNKYTVIRGDFYLDTDSTRT